MWQRTQNRHTLHNPVQIWSLTVIIFGNLPVKSPFYKRLPLNHSQSLRKGKQSKYCTVAFKKNNYWWNTCNNTGITIPNSVQKVFPQSGFSAVNSLPCQNSYRTLPTGSHNFAHWGYWSLSDNHSYFANQVRSRLVIYVSKSCMHTWNIFRRGQSLTGRSAPTENRPVHCVDVTS